jgi:2-phosphosulfolactate phosphatase
MGYGGKRIAVTGRGDQKMQPPMNQSDATIRCEWGEHGVALLAPISDVVIIVDVLSYSTCVEIATARGAIVFPYRWKDYSSEAFAAEVGAVLARSRGRGLYSLSPESLREIPEGTRLVLPSPNGSTLSLATGSKPTLTGCFRNAEAVARAARELGRGIAVIPAGERWPDGSLRPCIEDWLGAGALITHLTGILSPEATIARDAFRSALSNLEEVIRHCSSGKELAGMGYLRDVELASAYGSSQAVHRLVNGAFVHIDG